MSTPAQFVEGWIKRLRAVAGPALIGMPTPEMSESSSESQDRRPAFIDRFADGAGNRRALDRPMLAHVLRCPAGPTPALEGLDVESLAWWGLHDPAATARLGLDLAATGPFFPSLREEGIEAWTESELCALHALLWVGLRDAAMLFRCFAAARWVVEELQPDNATQRPWALHAFVALASDGGGSDARRGAADAYAQTLLHNAMVGGLDRFSAVILWDSAAWLEESRCGPDSGDRI